MSGRRVGPLNVSQDVILSSLVTYLRAQGGRDPDFIRKLDSAGYCCGFATLAAYGQWLEWQPKRIDEKTHQPIPRDDWTWFHSVLTMLARWDGQSELPSLAQQDIERLLSLVEYFQNIRDYLPIGQGDWHESLIDTQERQPTKEYSVAGLFTAKNLLAVLPDIVQEDRMILICSHNHDVSLLKHEGQYYFYDANSPDGVHVCPARDVSDVSLLVNRLFSAMNFDQETPSPLGFRMFNFGGQAATYPLHEALLEQVQDHQPSQTGYASNWTALHMAARIGSVESTSIHVAQGGINLFDSGGRTPAFMAASRGRVHVLRVLVASGANLDLAGPDGATPAFMAAQNGHAEALSVLAANGADLNLPRLDGRTPMYIAEQNGHQEAVNFIRSLKQRDVFLAELKTMSKWLDDKEKGLVSVLHSKIMESWGRGDNRIWVDEVKALQIKIENDRRLAKVPSDEERSCQRKGGP